MALEERIEKHKKFEVSGSTVQANFAQGFQQYLADMGVIKVTFADIEVLDMDTEEDFQAEEVDMLIIGQTVNFGKLGHLAWE